MVGLVVDTVRVACADVVVVISLEADDVEDALDEDVTVVVKFDLAELLLRVGIVALLVELFTSVRRGVKLYCSGVTSLTAEAGPTIISTA